MCLAVPARIEEIYSRDGLKMARVDFGGVSREVCLDYVPAAKVGEYCIIHVGFAISLLSEAEAQETLALLNEISEIEEDLDAQPSATNP
jgi:hydrogenase expression/formation protein HypC